MKKPISTCGKTAVLFICGGLSYVIIELLWRGYSHPSMFVLGGICFVLVGLINEVLPWSMGLIWQSLIGGTIITIAEFVVGLIINVWLGLGVWDYSTLPLNIMGQICLPFYFAWVALSGVAIVIDDWLRYWLWNEERPHYTII